MRRPLENGLERTIFASRWLLAPFFVGLIVAIVVLLVKFAQQLWDLVSDIWSGVEFDAVIPILTLVDGALLASLLLIIVFSGYENFVSKIGVGSHEDRPAWMGKVGFSDLKIKLIGAIVAISAVELLKAFLTSTQYTTDQLIWKVVIHLTFVVSGVLFAVTDRLVEAKKDAKASASAKYEET
jgi:uncharacterized protein (TIGR00645 family)